MKPQILFFFHTNACSHYFEHELLRRKIYAWRTGPNYVSRVVIHQVISFQGDHEFRLLGFVRKWVKHADLVEVVDFVFESLGFEYAIKFVQPVAWNKKLFAELEIGLFLGLNFIKYFFHLVVDELVDDIEFESLLMRTFLSPL